MPSSFESTSRASPRRRGRSLTVSPREQHYFTQVFARLRAEPKCWQQVVDNYQYFLTRAHLSRSNQRALRDLGWLIEANCSIAEVEQAVLAETRSGQRLRRFPLLFRGLLPSSPE
ncbi:hypothetical protein [Ferrimonas senticii]|uniref:hypothetical protein n=1 Tax=Ferrimonas senticii TaxID=394566 RepID=UPI000401BD20|nr:hypothetical protein [Ferrimonas senticii]